MARITNEQIMREVQGLKIVLLGVPDTEDMGLYGEVKDWRKSQKEMSDNIITRLDTLNGTVKDDHAWLTAIKWAVGVLLAYAITGRATGWW